MTDHDDHDDHDRHVGVDYAYQYAERCAAGRGEQWSPPPQPVPPSPPSPDEVMERYRRWCAS